MVLVPFITGLLSAVGPGTRRHLIGSSEAATGGNIIVKLNITKSAASAWGFIGTTHTNTGLLRFFSQDNSLKMETVYEWIVTIIHKNRFDHVPNFTFVTL